MSEHQPTPQDNDLGNSGGLSGLGNLRKRSSVSVFPQGANNPNARNTRQRKPMEKVLNEKLISLVPESKLYNQLLSSEKRLDAQILRKRMEYQENNMKPARINRTLRLFISNLANNQFESQEGQIGDSSSWTLKIEGKLLDFTSLTLSKKSTPRKLSALIKSLVVDIGSYCLDSNSNQVWKSTSHIEWLLNSNIKDVDGFEIKRQGSVNNLFAKIIIQLNNPSNLFQPSQELAEVINSCPMELPTKSDYGAKALSSPLTLVTVADAIVCIWQYCKHYKLKKEEDFQLIRCDTRLAKLFNLPTMYLSQLPSLLAPHLLPPEPIVILYPFQSDSEASPAMFDISVETDDEFKSKVSTILANNQVNRTLYALEDRIASNLVAINNARLKRDFLLKFSNDPASFINQWVASQAHDLDVMFGESSVNLEASRRASFYDQEWTQEAVFHYLVSQTENNITTNVNNNGLVKE